VAHPGGESPRGVDLDVRIREREQRLLISALERLEV
jgi:hypothetical protein